MKKVMNILIKALFLVVLLNAILSAKDLSQTTKKTRAVARVAHDITLTDGYGHWGCDYLTGYAAFDAPCGPGRSCVWQVIQFYDEVMTDGKRKAEEAEVMILWSDEDLPTCPERNTDIEAFVRRNSQHHVIMFDYVYGMPSARVMNCNVDYLLEVLNAVYAAKDE